MCPQSDLGHWKHGVILSPGKILFGIATPPGNRLPRKREPPVYTLYRKLYLNWVIYVIITNT